MTKENISKVWNHIETHSPFLLKDHKLAPWQEGDFRKFHIIRVDDFTELEMFDFESPQISSGDNPRVIKFRKNQVMWRDLQRSNSVEDILNPNKSIDERIEHFYSKSQIIKGKGAGNV